MQPQISLPPKIQPTNSYILQNKPIPVRSTREQGAVEQNITSSILDSLKIGGSLSSTVVTA